MKFKALLLKCPIMRWLLYQYLRFRGGAERPEYWQGNLHQLRQLTYNRRAMDEVAWLRTGQYWLEEWILPPIDTIVHPTWQVLEIGCGPGRLLLPLASRFQQVVGIDFSLDMVRYARRILDQYANVKILQNDGQTIPLADESMDFVFSVVTFQHMGLATIESYFKEVFRVLRPFGFFRFQTRKDIARRNASISDRYFLSYAEIAKLASEFSFEEFSYEDGWGHPTWHWFTLRKTKT